LTVLNGATKEHAQVVDFGGDNCDQLSVFNQYWKSAGLITENMIYLLPMRNTPA
jgi:hypothetical protein